MVRIQAAKTLGGALKPIDDFGEEILPHVAQGEIVTVELRRERNSRFHRKLFALLNIVLENQDTYRSMDDLLDAVKIAIGHCKTIQVGGVLVKIPKSISYAALDEDSFRQLYDRVVQWVIRDVIPGLDKDDLNEEVVNELREFAK